MTQSFKGPLNGIRVVDFCQIYAGPLACALLGTLGAEVIRVESQGRADMRFGRREGPNLGFNVLNHNKRGITLNLNHPDAVELAKKLIAVSDVVAENYRPGVMEKLGLGYETLKAVKPDIIMLSLSALGDSGPERLYGALAVTFSGLAGLTHLTGYEDGIPTEYRGFSDFRSGFAGAFATMSALYHRQQTGQGQRIDLSARDALTALVGDSLIDYSMNQRVRGPMGNLDEAMAPHNVYRCAGADHWVSIAVGSESEWSALCEAMGRPELAKEPRFCAAAGRYESQAELDAIISEWTAGRTDYEVTQMLQAAGVAAIPSMRSDEIVSDPHLVARGFLRKAPLAPEGEVTLVNPPWKMSAYPEMRAEPAPLTGEANDYVFKELLGLSDEEIKTLVEELAIY